MIGDVSIIDAWLRLGGGPIRRGRAVAWWRGGDGANITINSARNVWWDHARDGGGGVLALVSTVRGCDKRAALRWLCTEGLIQDNVEPPHERRRLAERRARGARGRRGGGWAGPQAGGAARRLVCRERATRRAAGYWPPTHSQLVAWVEPESVDVLASGVGGEVGRGVDGYVDDLSARGKADLGGGRDQLAAVATALAAFGSADSGVPASVISPSLLFDDVEVHGARGEPERLPIVPPPSMK